MKQRIVVLGATGTIGSCAIKNNQNHEIVGISYYHHEIQAKAIVNEYHIQYYFSPKCDFKNCSSYQELLQKAKPNLVVNAITGVAGLDYSIQTIQAGIDLALANKESLVMAGSFIIALAKQHQVKILPIDSEHSSLYELIQHQDINNIKKLYITCSGGRYFNYNDEQKQSISYEEAIKHPNWTMGSKISLDSATLINKCFEIVEAYYLFNHPQIQALYHPQSIVHSLVEFHDGSVFSNMSTPDMALAIDLAINHFKKQPKALIKPLNFKQLTLTFDEIDQDVWKPIKWAYDIINDQNHSLGIIINVANEYAHNMFKQKLICFDQIYEVIEVAISQFKHFKVKQIADIKVLISLMQSSNWWNNKQ